MNKKTKNIVALVINVFLVISTILVVTMGVTMGASEAQPGFEKLVGIGYLRAFTNLSNILVGIIALVLIVYNAKTIYRDEVTPRVVVLLQYIGTVAITVTMMTVVIFLSPLRAVGYGNIGEYFFLFKRDMFFFHLLNPVLFIVEYLWLTDDRKMSVRDNLLALIPVIAYGITYLLQVVILHNWEDFYNFTFGGRAYLAPIAMTIMPALTYLYGYVYRKIKK